RVGLLERVPHLLVVESICKSSGVRGLRLGLLACGDRSLADSVAARLPIWNINSLAEYFLQIVGKYEAAYHTACEQLGHERARLFNALGEAPILRPVPSK